MTVTSNARARCWDIVGIMWCNLQVDLQSSDATATVADSKPSAPMKQAPKPGSATRPTLTLPNGWIEQPIPSNLAGPESVLFALNRTMDAGMFLRVTPRSAVTDFLMFTRSLRSEQQSKVRNPEATEVVELQISGRRAWRYTVTGTVPQEMRITYLMTVIEGESEILVLNSWTSTPNFALIEDALSGLASSVAGL